ncbi:hypothetical protein HYH03_016653 [Edaphochlamys debaryana]|uniref:Diphthamide biosynthesis protein n=1 Tax=Edaphochlamys debaryana TaxID=47281 RepID=A0A836BPW2_9CHLO|nr:hypothetical protein HYH03_016653 [Edaphochlamys debaryana]|eukprot:KAG2484510.1 hypothetical protein HYH03_016653 [Edaphochlamys debaryana]
MGLAEEYDVPETVDYVLQGGYRNVALQFPDEQLADSPAVAAELQQRLGDRAKVFVLADTAYNPLGVDEVAAQHLGADCVVHYGRSSLLPANALPALVVLPKAPLDAAAAAAALGPVIARALRQRAAADAAASAAAAAGPDAAAEAGPGAAPGFSGVVVFADQGYQHVLPALREALQAAVAAEREEGGAGEQAGPGPQWAFAEVPTRSLAPAAPSGRRCAPAAANRGAPGAAASASAAEATAGAGAGAGTGGGCCGAAAAAAAAATSAGAAAPAPGAGCGAGVAGASVGEGAAQAAPGAGCGAPSCCALPAASSAAAAPEPSGGAASEPCAGGRGDGASAGTAEGSGRQCLAGLAWSLPPGSSRGSCLHVWVGPEGSSAQQVLQLTHSTAEWLSYDPAEGAEGRVREGLADDTRRLLKRRNFLVEKARAANIVGILVGTLGTGGFLDVISCLRRLVEAAGKKSYTFLMGKPNPAKLGNFPEVDVWVLVADPQGLILDCRDYLAPLVSPWEAALALTGRHIDPEAYRMDLPAVLEYERSLARPEPASEAEAAGLALASLGGLGLSVASRVPGAEGRHELVARNAAEFLQLKRSYKGLEMPATGGEPKEAALAVEGLSGRAAVYEGEEPRERSEAAW